MDSFPETAEDGHASRQVSESSDTDCGPPSSRAVRAEMSAVFKPQFGQLLQQL